MLGQGIWQRGFRLALACSVTLAGHIVSDLALAADPIFEQVNWLMESPRRLTGGFSPCVPCLPAEPNEPADPESVETPEPELPPEQYAATGDETISLAQNSLQENLPAYIDNASPLDWVRMRTDAAYGNRFPNRAEFFYRRRATGANAPGPRETNVDFQDITVYLEKTLSPTFSVFGEVGTRFLNPTINANTAGLGDINFGLKKALWWGETQVLSFQLRAYAPTGDSQRLLGVGHWSLEPALLYWDRLSPRSYLMGEFRYWIPIDGTDNFQGDILRYGIGYGYRFLDRPGNRHVTGIIEVVGWSVLNGQKTILVQNTAGEPGIPRDISAAGDTIINIKPGLRFGLGPWSDFYIGYGRGVTGNPWYNDIIRAEYRILY